MVGVSQRPGMGACPFDGGTTFRVWAPNASQVSVQLLSGAAAGQIVALVAEEGGCWSGDVSEVGPGDGYLYSLAWPDRSLLRIDPYARQVTNSAGHGLVYDEAAFIWAEDDYRSPPWDELVIYELHVGTFAPAGDGQVGNLVDAAARLPYLRDLGITAVELLPVAEFAGDRSWGYNPALPFAVEASYGGPDALKGFVHTAHGLGIAVLLDVVYNHLGPGDLDHDLWRFDGWYENNGGGIYFYQDWRADTGWGSRPDYGRARVRQYLRDNAASWLGAYRLDGLRLDATAAIRNATGGSDPGQDIPDGWRLLQTINDDVATAQPWKIRIAEDMRNNEWVTKPTAEGGAGFPAQWDPDFVVQVRQALLPPDDAARSMAGVAAAVTRRYDGQALTRVVFTESHDADANGGERVPEAIDPGHADSWWSKKRSTLGAALVLTAPGIPMLFQGQEFLENLWFADSRPVDWAKKDTFAGILALYRDLIRLRRDLEGHTRGLRGEGVQVHHVNDVDKVLAYHRWKDGGRQDDTVVLVNFANRAYDSYVIGLPRSGVWRVRFNSDWSGYDDTFGDHHSLDCTTWPQPRDGLPWSGNISIGPYTALILSQDD
ncbi:MAG: alpha-amylase family glycosyl hydrolase [Pseudonocardiaceae bacterium]